MRMVSISPWVLVVCLGVALGLPLPAAERVLADFTRRDSLPPVQSNQARVEYLSTGLRLTTQRSETWPGIQLQGPTGGWNLAGFGRITVALKNVGTNRAVAYCRVDNPGADGTHHCVTASTAVDRGQTALIRVSLPYHTQGKAPGNLFGMRGYPVGAPDKETFNPTNVTAILIFVHKPSEEHALELHQIRAEGVYTPPTAWITDADPFLPFIDTFGQYRHKPWPGKVTSAADLRQRRAAEQSDLASAGAASGWNAYGGWAAGPKLEATGWFRTEKYRGKWWLVDPEGRLFWSHGIDCVLMLDQTPIEEREDWFENPPWKLPEFTALISSGYALKGHYAGRSPRCFSFARANLQRKYGADWRATVPPVIHQRLRAWGLNTIGNWSDEPTRRLRRTPYTDAIGTHGARHIEGSEGYWGKFPDVFDPAFKPLVQRAASSRVDRTAGDPWCIGFFSDNEMSWGDELSLGLAALKSPADQPAKMAFIGDLRAKYGEIAKLNAAWGTTHTSWDTLREGRAAPEAARARGDLELFYTKTAETYFREVRDALRAVAPHQLYLGCRFAWVNPLAAAAAAKYCDVVSYNLYDRSVRHFQFNGGADVPLIIGEFHFGALDRGMFHTGLVPVGNQEERAQAYRDYVEGALAHPQFVGCHWFQYQDEPTTGRVYDEENYQIGFVDIADTPYPEITAASRAVASRMYPLRLGERPRSSQNGAASQRLPHP